MSKPEERPLEIELLIAAWDNVKKNLLNDYCAVDDMPSLDYAALPLDSFGDLLADLDNAIECLSDEYAQEDAFDYDDADDADIYASAVEIDELT